MADTKPLTKYLVISRNIYEGYSMWDFVEAKNPGAADKIVRTARQDHLDCIEATISLAELTKIVDTLRDQKHPTTARALKKEIAV